MLSYIAAGFSNLGMSANAMTVTGFAFGVVSGYFIATGQFLIGAVFVVLSGICDLLDGKIARLRAGSGRFGALLDSSLDRYTDAVFYGAMAAYFWNEREPQFVLLAFSAMAGAFQVSYVRARSEGLGQKCQVGFWERGERTVFIIAALLASNPKWCVAVLGTGTHVTALRRLLYSWKRFQKDDQSDTAQRSRLSWPFMALSGVLLLSLLLVRL